MKTESSLITSRNSSIQRAIRLSEKLTAVLYASQDGDLAITMPQARALMAELEQRVHEFNAYDNALTTV